MYSISSSSNSNYIVQILQNLYADTNGELTNFLQFSFQQFCLLPFETPLKQILQQFINDDYDHTKILAKHIVTLGQTPIMQNTNGNFLSAKQICTNISQQSMILDDIALKEKAIINYKSAIIKIHNNSIIRELTKIVKDEEIHLQMLKNLQQKLKHL